MKYRGSLEEVWKPGRNFVLGFAIFILAMFVGIYWINIFFDKPEYNDFCDESRLMKIPQEREICPAVCVEMYSIQGNSCVFNECGSGCGPDEINSFETSEQCEKALDEKNCYNKFDEALKNHYKKVFIVSVPLAIIIIALGSFMFSLSAVGIGLISGGIGIIIYGAGGYWRYADNLLKFIISLMGLIIIIWITYYFNNKFDKK